tara:strand:+ start:557 stop:1174 length:618 start_codon:yes stop_codon:yes gene_type:complete
MKYIIIILSIITISGCTVMGVSNSEEAAYEILFEQGNIQIRLYAESLIAQTTTSGNYKESSHKGFKRLAGYIFGDNQSNQKIEMTTPVIETSTSEKIAMTVPVLQEEINDSWTMTFVLPSKYTLDTIPKPINNKVKVIKLAGKKVSTIRYSGLIKPEKIEQKAFELQQWLNNNNYVSISKPYSAAYDPPWTLPFLRRNEVQIEIE